MVLVLAVVSTLLVNVRLDSAQATPNLVEFTAGITGGANANPQGITLGPDGNMWFTELLGDRIGNITPGGVITEFSAGITAGARPNSIALGPDGNLWFTESQGRRIGVMAPGQAATEYATGISPTVSSLGHIVKG
ncbi:MAG: putative antibiotic hydrolase, partial [Actinomycetia bacterium]|nr:putative antibiotic hydrolase [Actinomycetes bacterium]